MENAKEGNGKMSPRSVFLGMDPYKLLYGFLQLAENWSLRLKLEKKVTDKTMRWANRPIYSLPEGPKYTGRKKIKAGTAI